MSDQNRAVAARLRELADEVARGEHGNLPKDVEISVTTKLRVSTKLRLLSAVRAVADADENTVSTEELSTEEHRTRSLAIAYRSLFTKRAWSRLERIPKPELQAMADRLRVNGDTSTAALVAAAALSTAEDTEFRDLLAAMGIGEAELAALAEEAELPS